jgi:hypothetical protein
MPRSDTGSHRARRNYPGAPCFTRRRGRPLTYVDPQGQHLHLCRVDAQGTIVADKDYEQPEAAGWVQLLWPMVDGNYAVMATRPVAGGEEGEQRVLLQRRKGNGEVLFEKDVSVALRADFNHP